MLEIWQVVRRLNGVSLFTEPSSKERKSHPNLGADATVEVLIHQVDLDNGDTLKLVTNVEVYALSAGDVYQRRYDVEFDIRDLKVTMNTEKDSSQEC